MRSTIIAILFVAAMIIGEISCIVRAISCNWNPIGKAEIIYTGASVLGLGCVIGYISIEDK